MSVIHFDIGRVDEPHVFSKEYASVLDLFTTHVPISFIKKILILWPCKFQSSWFPFCKNFYRLCNLLENPIRCFENPLITAPTGRLFTLVRTG